MINVENHAAHCRMAREILIIYTDIIPQPSSGRWSSRHACLIIVPPRSLRVVHVSKTTRLWSSLWPSVLTVFMHPVLYALMYTESEFYVEKRTGKSERKKKGKRKPKEWMKQESNENTIAGDYS